MWHMQSKDAVRRDIFLWLVLKFILWIRFSHFIKNVEYFTF